MIPSTGILPPGWTEHVAPGGQPYFYNTQTRESTYIRPIQTTTKKEKPLVKTSIPGTEWLRVITSEGNTFYSHKLRKESVWVIPEEIRSAVEGLQAEERQQQPTQDTISMNSKRKAEISLVGDGTVVSKRAKIKDDDDGDNDEESSEDEDWQRQAAEQLATEAEEERKRMEAEMEKEKEAEVQRVRAAAEIIMPQKVDLSIEEGKALFKTLLREKDINPLHPWDTSLPKFVSDPRYVLLPSVAARREAFDEYCKERARELRQSSVKNKKDKEAANPKDEYDRLLTDEVKSTRASWTDFRRAWKKDRRFYGWGRDDREREKRFREFLKDLGEQKRAAAQKAEANFFALLKEHTFTEGLPWKEAKKILHHDTHYEAVGSSSLREELYNTFMKGRISQSSVDQNIVDNSDQIVVDHVKDVASDRQERRNKAVKEREDKIKDERRRLDAEIERSKSGINKEEGERTFMTLLTDAIRDPQVSWEDVLPQLKSDPRFTNSPLPLNHQRHLFYTHTSHLRSKYINSLHALFHSHAPTLATPFSALPVETILSSSPIVKLGFQIEQVEDEFDKWQRERTTSSRTAFDEMLGENSFVEFWGRLGKIGGEGVNSSVKIDGDDIGEGDDEEKVDMKALAKNVDVREMEKVLKGDSRYTAFDHVPEQRERWLRNYLSNLSASKLSVHVDG